MHPAKTLVETVEMNVSSVVSNGEAISSWMSTKFRESEDNSDPKV